MKKMYSAPVMEVEKFDVADTLLIDSGAPADNLIKNKSDGDGGYEVVIKSKW